MEESLKPQQMQERVYLGNNILSGQAIQINGDIQGPVNFRQDALRPSEPKPINRLPNILHSQFSGREKYLSHLLDFFSNTQSTALKIACIHGNLGLGKTQLALKYGADNKHEYHYRWYVNGSSQETYAADFDSIYGDLLSYHLVPKVGNNSQRRNVVLDWMSSCSKSWLLFIDNSSDLGLLKEHFRRDASSTHANILITTRIKFIATDLCSEQGSIELFPMDEREGELLVTKTLKIPEADLISREIATSITKAYDGLPLALVPALTACTQRLWSPEQLLQKMLSDAEWALKIKPQQTTAYDSNVEGALALALDQMKPEHQMLLHLLVLMSPQNLPITFMQSGVRGGLKAAKNYKSRNTSTLVLMTEGFRTFFRRSGAVETMSSIKTTRLLIDFLDKCCQSFDVMEDAVLDLQKAVVRRDDTTGHMWIHDAFCQALGTNSLNLDKQFLAVVASGFGAGALEDLDIGKLLSYERYLPHTVAIANHASELTVNTESQPDLCAGIGKLYSLRYSADDALLWYNRALTGLDKTKGEGHPDTLRIVHNIATVYFRKGNIDESLPLYERVLAGQENTLGKNHPFTLRTANSIATIYSRQGDYDTALRLYEDSLARRNTAAGEDHVDSFFTIHAIATIFFRQGDYGKALRWYERTLAGQEEKLGKDHLNTLYTVHSIATVYSHQEQYDTAHRWYQRALAGREKKLNKDHHDTLFTVYGIGTNFLREGRYEKALQWYKRALEGQEKALGKDHPETRSTTKSIQDLYESGKIVEPGAKVEEAKYAVSSG